MRFFSSRLWLLLFLMVWLGAGRAVFGQAPAWQDAMSPGGGSGGKVTVDAAGNTYVTGSFTGTATFGTITLTSAGRDDLFVAKRSPAGVWLWATSAGGSSYDYTTGVAVDGSGNVVVTGVFTSLTLTLGATTLTNLGSNEGFVAKLSPSGTWQWATGVRGSDVEGCTDVAVDGSGNVVVTGIFASRTIAFGATTLTNANAGYMDVFVAKLTPSGTWQWATSVRGSAHDYIGGVAVDGAGNVVVIGRFDSRTFDFGAITLTNTNALGYSAGFVAKLTPAGAWLWAVSPASNGIYDDGDVAVDGSGNVIVASAFRGPTITFGAITLTNVGGPDPFVAKLTPSGTWQWAISGGGGYNDHIRGMAVDGSGNVLVTGYFDSPIITFGTTTLTRVGWEDPFVAKLTPAGTWQWATSMGGSGRDKGTGVAVDGSDNVVITGDFTSRTLAFGATTLTNPIPNAGLSDYAIFVAFSNTVTGLPEAPSQAIFTLAPNPARTTVQLTGTPGAGATLLDGLGRVVRTAVLSAEGTAALEVRGLPAGLYLVRVGGSRARRLVVE